MVIKNLFKKQKAPDVFSLDTVNPWRESLRRLFKNKSAVVGLIVFLVICFSCAFAPLLSNYDYSALNVTEVNARPSREHLFGTDKLGRDLFTRILYGGRITLRAAFMSTLLATCAGAAIGLVSGYFGRRVDFLLTRIIDMLAAIPNLLLIIVMEIAFGWGKGYFMYAMAISAVPKFARLVRANVQSVMGREFIEASRALGLGHVRIILKHVLHNVLSPLMVLMTTGFAEAILNCTILGYLSVGVNPPTPEWGALAYAGRSNMVSNPHIAFFPCLVIVICVISVNFFGNGLRDALDPKENSL